MASHFSHSKLLNTAVALGLLIGGSFTASAQLRAGAGAAEIRITPDMLPVEGYTWVHDPISTRVLLLDEGNVRIAMLVVDTPSIQDSFIDSWKAILTKVTGVKTENALVIASHDLAAPHVSSGAGPGAGRDPSPETLARVKAYAQAVDQSIESAANKAAASLGPAQIGFGLGTSHINTNRYQQTPKGWTIGYNDVGFTDPSLAVVRFDTANGQPLAWIMDYAVRPAIMEQSLDAKGGKAITGDLVGASEHYLESHSGSSGTAFFLMGAGVDQTPYLQSNRFVVDKDGNTTHVDIHDAGFTLVDLLGERLGSEAVRVNEAIKTSNSPAALRIVREVVEVDTQVPTQVAGAPGVGTGGTAGEKVKVPFVLLQIGDVAIIGVAPELNANIGVKIKTESPFAQTIVVTMVDGSAKYLPDQASYDRKSPEALSSRFARGSAESVVTRIVAALKQLNSSR